MLKYTRHHAQGSERRRELVRELLASARGGVPIVLCIAPPKCDALMCERICKGRPPLPPDPPTDGGTP
jgi:hypothetical protein